MNEHCFCCFPKSLLSIWRKDSYMKQLSVLPVGVADGANGVILEENCFLMFEGNTTNMWTLPATRAQLILQKNHSFSR